MNSLGSPDSFPVEEALRAVDHYTLAQEGEPQLVTFGTAIKHYTQLADGKIDPFIGQPYRRKPVLVSTYETMEEMAVDLKAKAEADWELIKQRNNEKRERDGIHFDPPREPIELERTTASETELEAFEAECLGLDLIKEAARQRAERTADEDFPVLTLQNADTGESQTIVLDAARLIADGDLYVTRGRSDTWSDQFSSDNATVHTSIEEGELFKQTAARLDIDAANVALVSKAHRNLILYPADSFFGKGIDIANDFWQENGQYSDAAAEPEGIDGRPPLHSLYDSGNFRRVDSYDVEDFLDAAQAALKCQFVMHQNFYGTGPLQLQPLKPVDKAFHELRERMVDHGFELGYFCIISLNEVGLVAAQEDGRTERVFHISTGARMAIENSRRQFDRWQTPAIKKQARLAAR